MKSESINRVYLIGIGGIGMSALARYFFSINKEIGGYDKTPTPLTDELLHMGMDIHFDDDVTLIPDQFKEKDDCLVIYTPAISADHTELSFFRDNQFNVYKRSQVLGLIANGKYVIAVAGSHGKTTTASIIAHILKDTGYDCTAFLGGIATNYESNFISGKNDVFVIEADEFDRSFLDLEPDIAVITSIDADHLDIYGSKEELEKGFHAFVANIKQDGCLIINDNIENFGEIEATDTNYGLKESSKHCGSNILQENANGSYYSKRYVFEYKGESETISNLTLGLNGIHNIENAIAAIAVAIKLNIGPERIRNSLSSYAGVKRRFEYIFKHDDLIYIDDYAHHPNEVSACINSIKELYPDKKITAVFQPHLYSRTQDFMDEFAESLSNVDELTVLPIYPAREKAIEGVTSEALLEKIQLSNKKLSSKDALTSELNTDDIDVLLTIGAGDIDQLVPAIRNKCLKSQLQQVVKDIEEIFDGELLLNEPLSKYTTLKIGGPADIFLKPVSKDGLVRVMKYVIKHKVPFFVLGNGSNLLVGDKGIRGVTIFMKNVFDYLNVDNCNVTVGASYSLPKLSLETLKMGLQGLEGTAGIPATIGGAVRMNAGAYQTEMFDLVEEVQVIRNGELLKLKSSDINYRYRHTDLGKDIVLEATFKLNKVDNAQVVLDKRKELLDSRNNAQPVNTLNVGSLFKNPKGDHAARLIEASGLKGYKHGEAQVSDKHANFLINNRNASAKEMMELIELVKTTVYEKFKIRLEMEVQKAGEGF